MTFCEISPPQASAMIANPVTRTAVLTVRVKHDIAFAYLADIENLPRWARGFCERLYLMHGQWVALTSVGELFVAVENGGREGDVVLLAGWQPEQLHRLPIAIGIDDEGNTRIKFALDATADETHARIYRALEADFAELVSQLNERVARSEVGCAA
jgi:hypothetical protein